MKILCTKDEFRRIITACESPDNGCRLGSLQCCFVALCPFARDELPEDGSPSLRGDWLTEHVELIPDGYEPRIIVEVSGRD